MKFFIKRLIRYVFYFLPEGVKKKISEDREKKNLIEAHKRAKRTKVSKEEVAHIINSLTIGNCDIMLHTSVISIGKVQGGVAWITKCLLEKADIQNNTILVSALPYSGRFKEYLEKCDMFDVRTAPIEMGGVNEYIGSLPEAKRSLHPTHSIVAVGKDAEKYVCGHHLDKTPFGENSPYFKIIKNRGKAVMFGISWEHLTCIHAIEDMLGFVYPEKIYLSKTYTIECINEKGESLNVETTCHNPLMSCIRNLSPLTPKLLKEGVMTTIPIGESKIAIIDLYKFTLLYLNELEKGRSIYGRFRASKELKQKISEVRNKL